ncbi:carboxymuconolactone decarboxylase family protein [Shinella sp.]|uniref:carboxymuconolactone decarboxylase family protein n=1 Tax=Shinella sp. TaxID=1870904 RepID=UPI0029AA03D5|nr:carboxymuconolactone decarboxylase family protein [Shinella sp.]MDX3978450.1 carboxymuconolactone decarboxylase family protein [Shinella sp.]
MEHTLISDAFQVFIKEAPAYQEAWLGAVKELGSASKLDAKTEALVYIGILSATRLDSGIPFHVSKAKKHGATRDEVVSAILAGLPAVGNVVIQSLPVALQAYDG